jgi:hypothetical protein
MSRLSVRVIAGQQSILAEHPSQERAHLITRSLPRQISRAKDADARPIH